MTARCYPVSVVSVDVGGTKIAGALVTYRKEGSCPSIDHTASVPTDAADGGAVVLERIVSLVSELIKLASGEIAGIGVGTAGRVSALDGSIAHANEIMPGWTGQPVKARLEAEFALPVAVLGDVQAHALGEARWGAARGAQTCIVMAPGTGLGGGIVCHGRIVRGAHGFAGEIGSTINPLSPGEGNLESVASGSGIESHYAALSGMNANGAEISTRANQGDPIARKVIEDAGRALGIALAGWANVLDPDIAVVSGSVTKAGPIWREALEGAFAQHAPEVLASLPILDAQLGSAAPLVGAAENLLDALSSARTPTETATSKNQ